MNAPTCETHGVLPLPAVVVEVLGADGKKHSVCSACFRQSLASSGEKLGHTRTKRPRS